MRDNYTQKSSNRSHIYIVRNNLTILTLNFRFELSTSLFQRRIFNWKRGKIYNKSLVFVHFWSLNWYNWMTSTCSLKCWELERDAERLQRQKKIEKKREQCGKAYKSKSTSNGVLWRIKSMCPHLFHSICLRKLCTNKPLKQSQSQQKYTKVNWTCSRFIKIELNFPVVLLSLCLTPTLKFDCFFEGKKKHACPLQKKIQKKAVIWQLP